MEGQKIHFLQHKIVIAFTIRARIYKIEEFFSRCAAFSEKLQNLQMSQFGVGLKLPSKVLCNCGHCDCCSKSLQQQTDDVCWERRSLAIRADHESLREDFVGFWGQELYEPNRISQFFTSHTKTLHLKCTSDRRLQLIR